jgi:signal transduction histidine kinase
MSDPTAERAVLDELTRVNNDLTNLQREMARKNAELERLNQEKNRFVGMAAHDLRSPLGVIQTYAEFLEADAPLAPEHREFVSMIRQTSRFMMGIIEDLLDLSAIESGQLSLQREPTELTGLVRKAASLFGILASPKGIQIHYVAPVRECPPLEVDPRKLQQVLNNLLDNAVKYSARGSTVEVSINTGEQEVTVSVRDQGPGIAEADLKKLFVPFYRTGAQGTGGEPSTGLGLAIVKRIVEGHGGRVWAESRVGEGSDFRFSLPLAGAGA